MSHRLLLGLGAMKGLAGFIVLGLIDGASYLAHAAAVAGMLPAAFIAASLFVRPMDREADLDESAIGGKSA